MLYQQGDVLFKSVGQIPPGAKKQKRTRRGYVLAEGEATGHCHSVLDDIEYFERNGVFYIHAGEEFRVRHQEHKVVTLPPGDYEVGRVREYDHFAEEARYVRD